MEMFNEEGAERLFFAICERAANDYINNLIIIDHSKSEHVVSSAKMDNKSIRKFLGDNLCDAIEHEHYQKKEVIQINKLQRKHLDGKHVYSNQAERMKAYYELNKDVINAELKAVRDKRKELGLCTKCGKNKAVKGSNWCEVCRRKKQDRKKHKET